MQICPYSIFFLSTTAPLTWIECLNLQWHAFVEYETVEAAEKAVSTYLILGFFIVQGKL